MASHNSLMDPGEEGRGDDLGSHGGTESQRQWKKGDGGRRRPGPDTLEERIGKVADSPISPYPH
jgi:hypothetical protein